MFVDRLLNQGNTPVLEQMAKFTARRHELLFENVVNVDTPGYRQKDLSVDAFQQALSDKLEQSRTPGAPATDLDDVAAQLADGPRFLSHDGNNRSADQLMSDSAQNGMFHNLMIELLRKQFDQIHEALRERVT